MNIVADVSLLQAVTLFSVGFLGAIFGAIGSIVGGSKAKKAAQIAADNADKQRKLELQLAEKQGIAEQKKQDWIMKLALIGGGVLIFIVVIFMFKKKR